MVLFLYALESSATSTDSTFRQSGFRPKISCANEKKKINLRYRHIHIQTIGFLKWLASSKNEDIKELLLLRKIMAKRTETKKFLLLLIRLMRK